VTEGVKPAPPAAPLRPGAVPISQEKRRDRERLRREQREGGSAPRTEPETEPADAPNVAENGHVDVRV
jgi:hypothetical protein